MNKNSIIFALANPNP